MPIVKDGDVGVTECHRALGVTEAPGSSACDLQEHSFSKKLPPISNFLSHNHSLHGLTEAAERPSRVSSARQLHSAEESSAKQVHSADRVAFGGPQVCAKEDDFGKASLLTRTIIGQFIRASNALPPAGNGNRTLHAVLSPQGSATGGTVHPLGSSLNTRHWRQDNGINNASGTHPMLALACRGPRWMYFCFCLVAVVGVAPRCITLLALQTVPQIGMDAVVDFKSVWKSCKDPTSPFSSSSPDGIFVKKMETADCFFCNVGLTTACIASSYSICPSVFRDDGTFRRTRY